MLQPPRGEAFGGFQVFHFEATLSYRARGNNLVPRIHEIRVFEKKADEKRER